MTEELNRHFYKEHIQIANKYLLITYYMSSTVLAYSSEQNIDKNSCSYGPYVTEGVGIGHKG